MKTQSTEKETQEQQNQDSAIKPDPETLHTTDPEKKMEGPVSSLMQKLGEVFNTNETREEANGK